MKILVNNEIKELSLIDPKTGIDWVSDLLGNADACGYDEDADMPTMSDADYQWWDVYTTKEQDLQDRAKDIRDMLSDEDKYIFDDQMIDAADNDYEMTQYSQAAVIDKWESTVF